MERPGKRHPELLASKAAKIGDLLGLDPVPTFLMAWKEPRLDLPGGGECYPLVDVLECMAQMIYNSNSDAAPSEPEPEPDEMMVKSAENIDIHNDPEWDVKKVKSKKTGRPPKSKEK